jgi:hypothetical protein
MSLRSLCPYTSWVLADSRNKGFNEHAHYELSTVTEVQLNFCWDTKFDGILVTLCNRPCCYLSVCYELLRPEILHYNTNASTPTPLIVAIFCSYLSLLPTQAAVTHDDRMPSDILLCIRFSSSGLICNCCVSISRLLTYIHVTSRLETTL